jgi:hypothetical protein
MAQEKRKPDFNVRVKVVNRDENGKVKGEYWHDAGAAWTNEVGIGVKLTMLPAANWDGSLLLLAPKDDE